MQGMNSCANNRASYTINLQLWMIQVSDFGMSQKLKNDHYYVSHGGKIPVKWTAPEVL